MIGNYRSVYADHAATTKICEEALTAYTETARTVYANPSSLHGEGQRAKEALEGARKKIAGLLNCSPKEIVFTSGGSEADNQALRSAAAAGAKKGKKKIVSTAIEHHAVLHALEKLAREGFEIELIPVEENGIVSVEKLEKALDESCALVSVMYANNEIGTLQPVNEIGKLCRARKILFHTDAVQAVGHVPIDLANLPCDYLALSAHKFSGPKGVGALYARTGVPLFPLIDGGAQERGKRAGTEDVPAIAGMAAALEKSLQSREEKNARLLALREKLVDGLLKIPHSRLNGDRKLRLAGNANLCFEGCEGESLLLYLDDLGVAASSGSACTSGSLDPSHVLLAIGLVHDIAHGSLRLTLGEENDEEDAEYMIYAIGETVKRVRALSPVWRDLQTGKRKFLIP